MKHTVLFIILFGLGVQNMAFADQTQATYETKYNEASDYLDEQIKIRRDRLDAAKTKAGKQDLSDEEFIEWSWENHCKRDANLSTAERIENHMTDIDGANNIETQSLALFCVGRLHEDADNIKDARLHFAFAYEIDPKNLILEKALKRVDFFPPVLSSETAN